MSDVEPAHQVQMSSRENSKYKHITFIEMETWKAPNSTLIGIFISLIDHHHLP